MTEIGHNSDAINGNQLKSLAERIVRLEEEGQSIKDDIKEVFLEAKGHGYDVKVLRKAIAMAKRDPNERAEEEAILSLYLDSIGMLA